MPKKSSPDVLVAVVNKNGYPHLLDCVRSLIETNYPHFNVVVFDNGSTDRSFSEVKKMLQHQDNFFLVKSSEPIPLTKALNQALRCGKHDAKYLALIDSDVIVKRDWLLRLVEAMESSKKIGSCQSLLLLPGSHHKIDSTGDFMDCVGNAISRNSQDRASHIDLNNLNAEIFSARSASMIIRRDLFWHLGGMDDPFQINYEDVDLGWRIRLAGFSNRFVPSSIVIHNAGTSTGSLPKSFRVYLGTKNSLRMLLKNYEIGNMIKYASLRSILDIFTCVLLFFMNQPVVSKAILQGISWNLTHLPDTMKVRAFIQNRIRVIEDSTLMDTLISRQLILSPAMAWRLLNRS